MEEKDKRKVIILGIGILGTAIFMGLRLRGEMQSLKKPAEAPPPSPEEAVATVLIKPTPTVKKGGGFTYRTKGCRDPFVPLVGEKKERKGKKAPPSKRRLAPSKVRPPLPGWSLGGVLFLSGKRPLAVINNQVVGEGEKVGEAKVTSIQPGKVVLKYQGKLYTLTEEGETSPP